MNSLLICFDLSQCLSVAAQQFIAPVFNTWPRLCSAISTSNCGFFLKLKIYYLQWKLLLLVRQRGIKATNIEKVVIMYKCNQYELLATQPPVSLGQPRPSSYNKNKYNLFSNFCLLIMQMSHWKVLSLRE